jgi:hypothetical protein
MKIDFERARQGKRVPAYLGRDQSRIFYPVMLGGLFILACFRLPDLLVISRGLPTYAEPIDTTHHAPAKAASNVPLAPGDVFMQLQADKTMTASENGDFLATPPKEANSPESKNSVSKSKEATGDKTADKAATHAAEANDAPNTKAPQVATDYFPGLSPELLEMIKDSTFSRAVERPAWDEIMTVLQATPAEKLAAAAQPVQLFRELYTQPTVYRGKAIQLQGYALWYQLFDIRNADGEVTSSYYEVGIGLPDQKNTPVLIYSQSLPDDWPRGTADPTLPARFTFSKSLPVAVTGIFFKKMAYQAVDRVREAPTLLAATVELREKPGERVAAGSDPSAVMFGALLIISAGLFLGMLYVFTRKKTQFTLSAPGARRLPAIDPGEVHDPSEDLRRLSRQAEE